VRACACACATRARACVRVACVRVRDAYIIRATLRVFGESRVCKNYLSRAYMARACANRVSDVCACESFREFACVEILFFGLNPPIACVRARACGSRACARVRVCAVAYMARESCRSYARPREISGICVCAFFILRVCVIRDPFCFFGALACVRKNS